ncbi:MAG: hypothetical protein PUB22_00310 [Clostridiales bacterium]|nr:hypothetical protein [Clostridiales bacterium]
MKNSISRLILILCGILMVLFPKISMEGAANGLLQWFHHVLPVLLPFLFFARLSRLLFPLENKKKQLSLALLGLFCGYPMEAILASEECREGTLSRKDGQILLNHFNLPSPMYITGLVGTDLLSLSHPYHLLISVWLSTLIPWIPMKISALILEKKSSANDRLTSTRSISSSVRIPDSESDSRSLSRKMNSSFSRLTMKQWEKAWTDSCYALLLIGCYMIVFGILAAWITGISQLPEGLRCLILLLCEITTGCSYTAESSFSPIIRTALCAAGLSFGGLSCLAQTAGCIHHSGLSLISYLFARIISSILAFIICIHFF